MAWWLLQNAVATAGLALVVAAICRTTRIGPVGRHALWLVVLVKFVTPPIVTWPWTVPDPFRVAALGRDAARDGTSGLTTDGAGPGATAGAEARLPLDTVAPGSQVPVEPDAFAMLWPWLADIWMTGSLGLLGIESARLTRLARRTRSGAPAGPALARRVANLSAQMGLGPVEVRVVPGTAPPSVWCGSRPRVLVPAGLASSATELCLDGLLVHELAHVKRRDHLVAWIELVAGIAWWWNPLFWFVRASLREQAELACDAWVVSTLPNGRRAYAESLLALSGADVRGPMPMAAVGVRASSRRVLERRLVMIMQGRTPLRLTRVGTFTLALVAATTIPGWAASQNPPPPPPPPPVQTAVRPAPAPPVPAAVPVPATRQTPPVPRPVPAAAPKPVEDVQVKVAVAPDAVRRYMIVRAPKLPAEGTALVDGFAADREAIEREVAERIEARRLELVASLERLQDEYTKAGKLDEAVAIRDFLRAGLPGVTAGTYVAVAPKKR